MCKKIEFIIFYLLQDEEMSVKFSAFSSGKNRVWSIKSQGILFFTEDGHPDNKTIIVL